MMLIGGELEVGYEGVLRLAILFSEGLSLALSKIVVGRAGFEPATLCLKGRYSTS